MVDNSGFCSLLYTRCESSKRYRIPLQNLSRKNTFFSHVHFQLNGFDQDSFWKWPIVSQSIQKEPKQQEIRGVLFDNHHSFSTFVSRCTLPHLLLRWRLRFLLLYFQVRRGAGVLATSRRIGPELSRRIHFLLTSEDGELSMK